MNKHSCLKNNDCKACSKIPEVMIKKKIRIGDLLNRIEIPEEYIKLDNRYIGYSIKEKKVL